MLFFMASSVLIYLTSYKDKQLKIFVVFKHSHLKIKVPLCSRSTFKA